MKIRILFLLFLLQFLCGCATHYCKSKENTLYIYLKEPKAVQVFFLYSNDGYLFNPATKIGKQTWEVKVPANREFKYFYIIDGKPFIPDCRYKEADDFGSHNCIYVPVL